MFDLKFYETRDLPNLEILDEIPNFFNNLSSWNQGICLNGTQTYNTTLNSDYWAARHTLLSTDFSLMQQYLLQNHTLNEQKYMSIIGKVTELESKVDGWQKFNVVYNFPFPFKNREMPIWITTKQITKDTFVVLTLPAEVRPSGGHVRGMYVALELVNRTSVGSEWFMATSSNANGWIPKVLQDMQICKVIAKDVIHFLEFIA